MQKFLLISSVTALQKEVSALKVNDAEEPTLRSTFTMVKVNKLMMQKLPVAMAMMMRIVIVNLGLPMMNILGVIVPDSSYQKKERVL